MSNSIEDIIRAIVRDELRAMGVAVATAVYTRDALPPGYTSPEAFAAACRKLRLDAKYKAGRGWAVPHQVWVDARRPRVSAEDETIDKTLEAAGLRLTRKVTR